MANYYLTRNNNMSDGESNIANPGKKVFPVVNVSYVTGVTGTPDIFFLPDPLYPVSIQVSLASTGTFSIEGTDTSGSVVNGVLTGTPVWTAITTISGGSLTGLTVSTMALIQGPVAIRISISANATGINFNLRSA